MCPDIVNCLTVGVRAVIMKPRVCWHFNGVQRAPVCSIKNEIRIKVLLTNRVEMMAVIHYHS